MPLCSIINNGWTGRGLARGCRTWITSTSWNM